MKAAILLVSSHSTKHSVVRGRSTILRKIMDILLTRYFYPCLLFECTFCNLPVSITIETSFLVRTTNRNHGKLQST